MIVDALIPDPRRAGSVRVVVAGRPAWTVLDEVIAALGLVSGATITGRMITELDRAADEEGALRSALRALERRSHSERELVLKLERKGHVAEAIQSAIERLRRNGMIDDLAFARQYAMHRSARGRGPVRLRHDLARLGVDREIIASVIKEHVSQSGDPLEQPRRLVARRLRQVAPLPRDTRRRRLLAYLARRGYSGADARRLVDEQLDVAS